MTSKAAALDQVEIAGVRLLEAIDQLWRVDAGLASAAAFGMVSELSERVITANLGRSAR